jgi:hypothetical protein
VKENQHSTSSGNNSGDNSNHEPAGFTGFVEVARRAAIFLLRTESLFLIAIAGYLVISAITKKVEAPSALAGEILFAITGAVGLYFASRGFAQSKSYGRAPALLANLIALGVAYFMITGSFLALGIPLALLAGVTAISSLLGYSE